MPSFEVLLPIGAIGFYLIDSVLMLYGNELALERRRAGWTSSGGYRLQLGGRLLFLPNPLTPGRLLFRLQWDARAAVPASDALDVAALHLLTRPIRVIVQLQAVALIVFLPPLSLTLGAGPALLALFAAFYVLTAAAIAVLIARRQALGVSNRTCAVLALEALACAPLAVNLVRKISLSRSPALHWLTLAVSSFTPAEKQDFGRRIIAQLDQTLAVQELNPSQALELQNLRITLQERLDVTG